MPIRMSGMVSGLDTESIVKELVKVQQGRLDKIKNKQTKLDWKTEKWQDLNKKITNFFKDSLTDMRFESSYNTKSATIKTEFFDIFEVFIQVTLSSAFQS